MNNTATVIIDEDINFENSTINKKTAVTAYGSDVQKAHFDKYDKFKNKNLENALIKTLEQTYDSVELVKVAGERAKQYKLGGKKAKVSDRKDERATNGRQTNYTKSLDAIVIAGLEKRRMNKEVGEQTMKKWLLDFGLINQGLFDLMGDKHNKGKFDKTIERLVNEKIIKNGNERKVVLDYIFFSNGLNQQLKNSLEKMKKAGIVKFMAVPYAKIRKDKKEDKNEYKSLKMATYQTILERKTELMEMFSLTDFELAIGTPTEKLKAFKLAYANYLKNDVKEDGKHLNIDFVYESYSIFRVATKVKTRKYLEKNNKEAFEALEKDELKFVDDSKLKFMDERLKYVLNKANLEMNKKKEYQGVRIKEHMDYNNMDENDELILENVFYFDYQYQQLIMDSLYVKSIQNLQEYFGDL